MKKIQPGQLVIYSGRLYVAGPTWTRNGKTVIGLEHVEGQSSWTSYTVPISDVKLAKSSDIVQYISDYIKYGLWEEIQKEWSRNLSNKLKDI